MPMVLVVPGCKVEPPARVCSTKVHLTYAGLWPGELRHTSILSEARSGAAEKARWASLVGRRVTQGHRGLSAR
jgi:hypothetical protein